MGRIKYCVILEMGDKFMQIFYTVRSGDTLYSIATRWSIPFNSIVMANNLVAPYIIFSGQQLSLTAEE